MNRREFILAGGAVFAAGLSPKLFAASPTSNQIQTHSPSGDQTQAPLKVLALVFDDYETLDLHGPLEMLGHLPSVEITLIGPQSIVRSYQGPRVVADRLLDEVVECDLLLVPGGMGTRKLVDDARLLEWLKRQAKVSNKVFSVCTGAALLAKADLLNGVSATTNKMAYSWVIGLNDKVIWQPSARWMDDGRFLTSSGVSAGIDAALFYIAQTYGEAQARKIEALTEYQWNSDADKDPYAVIS
ncbi:DJ-1/PfpI family protein [Shewanella halotolerans]|uniref:DJ-1/PfpI family protein n=1 Tax=Shewanella halotolerans TaxID=2864204 RepID=UPI001C65A251|nr:DJ-1/PfpI family protein [Shewanella halotolerans]QYJ89875.1 DJ-1/PfpI family protein [Shewanella halotolerans]